LNPDVRGGVVDHPFLEPIKNAREDQSVEDDQTPERDPVNGPEASEAAVQVGFERISDWRVPHEDAQEDCDDSAEDRGKPCGETQGRKHVKQSRERNHGDQYG
jgi:hypothetical protein